MIGKRFEKYNYDYFLKKALDLVPDDVDKREGSIIYDALAPCCMMLTEQIMLVRDSELNRFIDTTYGEYLDNIVIEEGITRYAATKAKLKATILFKEPVFSTLGYRFSSINRSSNINYRIIDTLENNEYLIECDTTGSVGNEYIGDLLPITNIKGLISAKVTGIYIAARDTETDKELKERYYLSLNQKPFSGNIDAYDSMLRNIDGISEAQIYPVWDGGGTVKCSIIDNNYRAVSNEFLNEVQNIVDPNGLGQGIGIAPIDHKVTITTPNEVLININASVFPSHNVSLEQITEDIKISINEYLLTLRKNWGLSDDNYTYSLTVYASQILAAILRVPGVANATNITLNNNSVDITLTQSGALQEIPVIGEVVLSNVY